MFLIRLSLWFPLELYLVILICIHFVELKLTLAVAPLGTGPHYIDRASHYMYKHSVELKLTLAVVPLGTGPRWRRHCRC